MEDYDASIHREILDALVREDASLVEICEDRAIAEARSYLSRRYDCDRIFSAKGEERNQLVLMMVIDMAVYHIFASTIPETCRQSARTGMSGQGSGWRRWRTEASAWTVPRCFPRKSGQENQP